MLLTLPTKLTKTAGHANVDIRYPTADSTYRTMNASPRNASSPNVSLQENLMKRVIMRKKNNDDGMKNSS